MKSYVDSFSLQDSIVIMVLKKSRGGENFQFEANMPKFPYMGALRTLT